MYSSITKHQFHFDFGAAANPIDIFILAVCGHVSWALEHTIQFYCTNKAFWLISGWSYKNRLVQSEKPRKTHQIKITVDKNNSSKNVFTYVIYY